MLQTAITELVNILIGDLTSSDAQFMKRAENAIQKVRELQLQHKSNLTSGISRIEKEEIFEKTGVEVDPNPYFRVDNFPKLLNCIIAVQAQGTQPELILALWMKEATLEVLSEMVLSGPWAVTTTEDAKAMFIAMNFFKFLGADLFVRYKPASGGDNILLEDGRYASEHKDILERANSELMRLGFAKGDYAKIMRDNLIVTGGNSGVPYTVQARGSYYAAMLSMTHALFQKIKTEKDTLYDEFTFNYPLSDQLTYIIYNSGRGSKKITNKGAYALFKSHKQQADSAGMKLEDFLLQTKIIGKSWAGPRTNAVRFDYYLKCYRPIFTA